MIPQNVLNYCKERWGSKLPLPSDCDLRLPAKEAWQGSEHDLQKRFFRGLSDLMLETGDFSLWLSHAIPNGGKRSRSEAASFVAEGVKSGIPDTFFPFPKTGFCGELGKVRNPVEFMGLYIEFKAKANGPKEDQRAMALMLLDQGYKVVVVNDLETANKVFREYMQIEC